MVNIIGISGIGGSGKSSLAKALASKLKATLISWDDFDAISKDPDDYIAWYHGSRNYDEWEYEALAKVLADLKLKKKVISPATAKKLLPTDYIVFDAPLGRKHKPTGQYIDFCIFLNTPLDIALARRLLRDFQNKPSEAMKELLEELKDYLTASRPLYAMDYADNKDIELSLDGSQPIPVLIKTILEKLPKQDEKSNVCPTHR